MWLHSIEIKNYRSLEHVKLDNLQRFNVLIGRNNAGKSSVFLALYHLGQFFRLGSIPFEVLTARDTRLSLEIDLVFTFGQKEREEFLDLLIANGLMASRRQEILESPFLEKVHFLFRSPAGRPELLHLRETWLLDQIGIWATIQKMTGIELTGNPEHRFISFAAIAQDKTIQPLTAHYLNVDTSSHVYQANLTSFQMHHNNPDDPLRIWLYNQLYQYFLNAYFFNPFRHSETAMVVQGTSTLAQNGSNLALTLHTLLAKDTDAFFEIERFVHAALPDVGKLQTPINGNQTNVEFRIPKGKYSIPLTDMGGGIEQLLMVATVLLTTNVESSLFLEEPESHLHAGAQRYLLERLYNTDRQVFITTHSPTFINITKPFGLYQVINTKGKTTVTPCDLTSLDTVLEDIDVRNSDVLLSDAILFVEGPGDRDVMTLFSEKLDMNVAEHNITVLPMGGGKGAPVRSTLLGEISRKAPVPHVFLLDHDERSKAEIHNLETRLKECVHILKARELENYLLVPYAILEALKLKHQTDQERMTLLATKTEEDIKQLIISAADKLYGTILIKRIRNEIGNLRDGLLPASIVSKLTPHAQSQELSSILKAEISLHFEEHLINKDLDRVVAIEKEALDREWEIAKDRLYIAPGEEILTSVFQELKSVYRKPKDTLHIAQCIRPEDIDKELKTLIEKVYALRPA